MKTEQQQASRRQSRFAWGVCVLVVLLGLASMLFFTLNRDTPVGASWGTPGGARNNVIQWLNILVQALMIPTIAAVLGALIISRLPRHRIGWLLLAIGVVVVLTPLTGEYAIFGAITQPGSLPGVAIVAWVCNWIWVASYSLLVYTLAVFPNGRFLSSGWMLAVGIPWFFFTAPFLLAGAIEQPMSSAYSLPNPFVTEHRPALYNTLFGVAVPMMAVMVIMVCAQVAARYRGAGFVEREQIKWLLAGVAGLAAMVVFGLSLVLVFGLFSTLGAVLVNMSPVLPLLAIGVSILRYRLFDIDLIIRRTLIYAVLTGLLALVYFGSVTLLSGLFSQATGQQSALAIVVSTLLIAALFTPLRRRIQDWIDRRFFRKTYDAQQVLAQFAQTARDETDLDTLLVELVQVVDETLQPEHVSIALFDASRTDIMHVG